MSPAEKLRRGPSWLQNIWTPSFVDILFVAVLVAAFLRPSGLEALLADGDTGWHIRTGELVLRTGSVPLIDPFSFTRSGQPWFAWEWGADTLLALTFLKFGLAGVARLAAVVLSLSAAALFAWLLRRECGLWISLAVTFAVVSASSIHYLARPHVFSILFYTFSLWILDEDRRRKHAMVWLLPVLCGVWVNLHAGFVALPATLVLACVLSLAQRDLATARRYGTVALACVAASFVNPYGWQLHRHILSYLTSTWIMEHVQEFQSPAIRSEGMIVFAVLLLAGVALASRAIARGRSFEGVLLLAWSFAALRSARHIPLFAIAAAPVLAAEFSSWLTQWAACGNSRSLRRAVQELGQEFGRRRHPSLWLACVAVLTLIAARSDAVTAFPSGHFPVRAVESNHALLVPTQGKPRILSSDQWSDYLIFRLYPDQCVFFDGRSDFYGPSIGADYRVLQAGTGNWRELLERYDFDLALLPRDWPLSTVLDREPGWRLVYQDKIAVLVERTRVGRISPDLARSGAMRELER